jgi:hypothetical protein
MIEIEFNEDEIWIEGWNYYGNASEEEMAPIHEQMWAQMMGWA